MDGITKLSSLNMNLRQILPKDLEGGMVCRRTGRMRYDNVLKFRVHHITTGLCLC